VRKAKKRLTELAYGDWLFVFSFNVQTIETGVKLDSYQICAERLI
jgi:hypothetical protein